MHPFQPCLTNKTPKIHSMQLFSGTGVLINQIIIRENEEEDCIELRMGEWNDISCLKLIFSICKKNNVSALPDLHN